MQQGDAKLWLVCRLRLPCVNRELRRWCSAEHGDELWRDVELSLTAGSLTDTVGWGVAKWLKRHIRHLCDLTLLVCEVRDLAACRLLGTYRHV